MEDNWKAKNVSEVLFIQCGMLISMFLSVTWVFLHITYVGGYKQKNAYY